MLLERLGVLRYSRQKRFICRDFVDVTPVSLYIIWASATSVKQVSWHKLAVSVVMIWLVPGFMAEDMVV